VNSLVRALARSGLLREGLDEHIVRASMVLIFVLFGYQKWFEYEAQTLVPFIRNGPLTFWMYPVFGLHGASWFLGVSEWLTAALLVWGFWNPRAGVLGAILSVGTFVTTVTIIRARRGSTAWDPTADTGGSVDTGGQALLQEDHQLFLLSFREGSGPEPLVQDREPHDLGDDHRGSDLGVGAV
jgi:hypothetical protein